MRSEPTAISSTLIGAMAEVVNSQLGPVDGDALIRIVRDSRDRAPDATDEEILEFTGLAATRIRRAQNIWSPVGLLIRLVPRYFEGDCLLQHRERKRRAREIRMRELEQQRASIESILNDPNSDSADRDWAREALDTFARITSNNG